MKRLILSGLALACLATAGIYLQRGRQANSATRRESKPSAGPMQYVNVTKESGISFRHDDCRKGMSTMMEQAGPGCALLDYDGDGWLDIYFLNGRDRYNRGIERRNALYRNN